MCPCFEERKKGRLLWTNLFLEKAEQIFRSEKYYLQVWSLKWATGSLCGPWGFITRRTTCLSARRQGGLWDTSLAAKFRKEQTPQAFREIQPFFPSACHSSFSHNSCFNKRKEAYIHWSLRFSILRKTDCLILPGETISSAPSVGFIVLI